MAGFAAVGFFTIRRDVENLRVISQDNTQWSASQMEVELLRFRLSLAALAAAPTPEALDEMHERFDILWSRVFMMGHGHVGESLARYDAEHGSVAAIADYLKEIDPRGRRHRPVDDAARSTAIEASSAEFQQRAARVHPAGDARRRRRRRAGARADPVERPHDRGDQPRGGAGQRAVARS